MKLVIGSDHGGYDMKLEVIEHLKARGFEVTDVGTDSPASCDYPVYAKKLTDVIKAGDADLGILICGTGIGMSMAANKEEGIRAALCHDVFSAEATRSHNNANVLCMGARVIGPGLALMIVDKFIDTPFSNDERHIRRLSYYAPVQ
ncbi:MAG: ribose 5-phosphate isomerase B [Eubacterium sp.]|nr:ribose 5-phosphate isomerase B [Eubacterium sp.]